MKIRYLLNPILLLLLFVPSFAESGDSGCLKSITLFISDSVDKRINPGLSEALEAGLYLSLHQEGYCVSVVENEETMFINSGPGLSVKGYESEKGGVRLEGMFYSTLEREETPRKIVEVRFDREHTGVYRAVFIRKVIENLRRSSLYRLRIESEPKGVDVSISEDVEGVTPVEWVVSKGEFEITAEKEGYLDYRDRIDIEKTGDYNVYIKMVEREFYHSKLMYPFIGNLLTSGMFFGISRVFHSKYESSGRRDTRALRNSEVFNYAAIASVSASGLCFMLSFKF